MPPRLSKRLQREQEELEALGKTAVVVDQWSEEEIVSDQKRQRASSSSGAAIGFAALLNDEDKKDESQEEEEDEEVITVVKSKKGKSKKKKKKASQAEDSAPAPDQQQRQPSQPAVKSQKLKAKERQTASASTLTSSKSGKSKAKEDDEFEKALAELSGKFSATGLSSPSQDKLRELTQAKTLYSLLSVNLKNLDPEAELRRFFGSKVIASSGNTASTSHTPRIRSNLAKQQSTWPPLQYLGGLSMRELTDEEYQRKKDGHSPDSKEKWWTIDANPRYKGVTYEYLQCVMGGDPQFFFNLLYEMPWHADTLLQVAEVFRHREEHSSASDLTSRALFAYERSFAPSFNFTTGVHRLDFDHVENRVLYLALSRHIIDLNRRGTPQTAFEFARLLFGLDPYTDPHGSSLYLDSFAIKAKQYDWLLKVWSAYEEMETDGKQINVTLLPGWSWSKALALFEQEGDRDSAHIRSTEALKTAILTFPTVAPLLADKLDITMKEELRRLDCFKIITEYNSYRDDLPTSVIHLLSHIYVLRSFSLWKPPARADWFSKTLASIPVSSFSSTPLISQTRFKEAFSAESALTDSFYRHVIVASPLLADFRHLSSFLPSTVKVRMQGTIEGDPLPPIGFVTAYNNAYFAESSVDSNAGGNVQAGGIREFMINGLQRVFANNTEQAREIERILQQHPQFLEIFPGGIEDFARMVREVPNEVVNLMGRFGGAQRLDADLLDEALNPDDRPAMPGDLNADNVPRPAGMERTDSEEDGEDGERPYVDDPEEEDDDDEEEQSFPMRMFRNLAGRIWGQWRNQDEEVSDDDSDTGDTTNRADEVD